MGLGFVSSPRNSTVLTIGRQEAFRQCRPSTDPGLEVGSVVPPAPAQPPAHLRAVPLQEPQFFSSGLGPIF